MCQKTVKILSKNCQKSNCDKKVPKVLQNSNKKLTHYKIVFKTRQKKLQKCDKKLPKTLF